MLHRQPESSGLWSGFSYSQQLQKYIWKENLRVIIWDSLLWTPSSPARQRRKLPASFLTSVARFVKIQPLNCCSSAVGRNSVLKTSTGDYGDLFILNWGIQTPVDGVGMLVTVDAFLTQTQAWLLTITIPLKVPAPNHWNFGFTMKFWFYKHAAAKYIPCKKEFGTLDIYINNRA